MLKYCFQCQHIYSPNLLSLKYHGKYIKPKGILNIFKLSGNIYVTFNFYEKSVFVVVVVFIVVCITMIICYLFYCVNQFFCQILIF